MYVDQYNVSGVKVEPRRDDQNPSEERIVTIKGNSDACWRVSYHCYKY